jgi:hypothetical protein
MYDGKCGPMDGRCRSMLGWQRGKCTGPAVQWIMETVGLDPATWTTKEGYPHSLEARVIERYTRVDHNDMKLKITMIDPKIYTGPFEIETEYFRWVPNQQLDEWLCIPSETYEYQKLLGDPAGTPPGAPSQERQ